MNAANTIFWEAWDAGGSDMGILQANSVCLSFGDRTLLDNISFVISSQARTALAGGNGEGKTTLMKILAGLIPADSGSITCTRGMRVSYLPQSDIILKNNTVYEEIEGAFNRFTDNLERQREIGELLQNSSDSVLITELNDLQEQILNSRYYMREAIITEIAKGLGLSVSDMKRRCCEFSGGFQMRIALAKILAEEPDLMMLDEPTNYLDIEARTWLKSYLRKFRGSLLLVCHDKGFLDDTVNEVYELSGSHISRYNGNYSFYENQRRLEIQQLENAFRKQREEIEKTEQFIEKFRYKATKAKQVQSRVKMLEKIHPVVIPQHLKTLSFTFPEPPHSPNDVVIVENLCKKYGNNVIFRDFSMLVPKGQHLAVTGHNGAGKSTLLRIIAEHDSDFEGIARLGSGVVTGYYSQDTADSLDMEGTVLSQVEKYGSESQMRNALGSFLFSGDDIYKKTSVLSGGERSRLALLKILLQPASLLILDEPTNHLDINAKDMLLEALKKYKGTIIFVSHDAYFIRALADRILYLSENKPEFFNGDYDYFEWKMNQRLGIEGQAQQSNVQKNAEGFCTDTGNDRAKQNRERNRQNKLKREIYDIENKIKELEKKIAETDEQINLPENYSDTKRITELTGKRESLIREKEEAEELWLAKSESF